jgi:DNA-binding PadR family transcriptional regulator
MALGLFLWHISGMEKKGKALKVRPERVKKEFGLSSKSVYRALNDLEKAALITCERKRGRCARVHIVTVEREGERACL